MPKILYKLYNIEDNGGIFKLNVWKNGNHVDGDLYINDYNDAVKLAEENDADEIEATIWYSKDDYDRQKEPDKYVIIHTFAR